MSIHVNNGDGTCYPPGNFWSLQDADAFHDEPVMKIKELPGGERVRRCGSVRFVEWASLDDKSTASFSVRWDDGTYENMFPSEFKRCHRRHIEATQAANHNISDAQGM